MRQVCSIAGCTNLAKSRTWCPKHYERWRLRGDPLDAGGAGWRIRKPREPEFWKRVEKTETCWLWRGPVSPTGYSSMYLSPGHTTPAHRFAYELLVGPIPEGLQIDHLCRVRHCVNPAHLEPVTCSENLKRGRAARAKASA